MKNLLIICLFSLIFYNNAMATQRLVINYDEHVSRGKAWYLDSNSDPDGYNCMVSNKYKSLTFMVATTNSGQTGIYLTCDGVNGVTTEHLLVGQSSKLCTITCNTNQNIQWIPDKDKIAAGIVFYQYSKN